MSHILLRSFGALLIVASVQLVFSSKADAMQGMQTQIERMGIGIASLAAKKCHVYRLGPGVERQLLRLNATTAQSKAQLIELAEKDAQNFLDAQGKELCDVAKGMAENSDMLTRI